MTCGIIIPTLNEADHIGRLLSSLSDLPADMVQEILVADGGSSDGTPDIVRTAAAEDSRIRLIDNPARLQSSGINIAAAALHSDIDVIVRIDAHAHYPPDYVPALLRTLNERDCDSVVVRLRTVGGNCVQNAIALVSNGRTGTGGSDHRMGNRSLYVDHGHHAAFRRVMFDRAGGYDPAFRANEDAELDYRIRKLGGKIWLNADLVVDYTPRKTVAALARQYWRYGVGRAQNFLKHGERLRLRQVIPPTMVSGLVLCTLGGAIFPPLWLIPLCYAALLGTIAAVMLIRSHQICALYVPLVVPAMHLSWGAGFIARLLRSNAALQK